MKELALVGVVGVLASGCLLDHKAATRPARFNAGPNMRALSVPTAGVGNAGKTAATSEPQPAGRESLSAMSASLQFTMQTSLHTYAGAEAETGRLERATSNFAGGYGIVGAETGLGFGSVGVELAAGWRGVRYGDGGEEEDRLVVEPRVRGQVWIGDQWTLGGAVGTIVGNRGEWMAGLYLGVHSVRF